ncbi:MAG: GLUG motif-containing protein [Planctomycetota bacterium]|jgi:hypothetical protein
MQRRAIPIWAVVVLLWGLAVNVSTAKYSGGTGEPNDPYRIATPADLNDIGNHIEDFNKHFVMISDINLAAYTYTTALIAPDTNSSITGFQGTAFTGVFDGNNLTISKLTVDTMGAANDYLGLFGRIEQPGRVNNLTVEGLNISGGYGSGMLGGLSGVNYRGEVSRCFVAGSIAGAGNCWYLGGISGVNARGTFSDSGATVSVIAGIWSDRLGGFCGMNNFGTVSNCYSTGDVMGGGNAYGGFCGYNNGIIRSCYATGSVSGGNDSRSLGGLCGVNGYGTTTNSYATGSIAGGYDSQKVGGLCGYNYRGSISRCYAIGVVDGSSATGALVGDEAGGTYNECFWDSDANPDVNGIGNGSDPNAIGKTTAEMQTESTFTNAGWDFVDVWDIGENQTYPFLRVHSAGDLNHSGLVDWRDIAVLAGHWLEGTE